MQGDSRRCWPPPATDEDDPAGVQLLLKHKAKVDARDARGRSALHEAALAGHADIVATLLAAGADVQARDDAGRTPLLDAARGGTLPALDRWPKRGADVGAADAEGRDALLLASARRTVPPPRWCGGCSNSAPIRTIVDRDGKRASRSRRRSRTLGARRRAGSRLPAAVAAWPRTTTTGRRPIAAPLSSAARRRCTQAAYDGLDSAGCACCSPQELGSLLHDPRHSTSAARVDWLLAHGADAEARDAQGDAPIVRRCCRAAAPRCRLLQALLQPRGRRPPAPAGLRASSPRCAAGDQAERALEHCALDLLERGADPFARSRRRAIRRWRWPCAWAGCAWPIA